MSLNCLVSVENNKAKIKGHIVTSAPVTFSALFDRWAWRPIPNCPGRYVLAAGPVATPPQEIVPGASGGPEHVCALARDPVIVTLFEDGGLISYRKAEGMFLHTLNTREGFERKLHQLGITTSHR